MYPAAILENGQVVDPAYWLPSAARMLAWASLIILARLFCIVLHVFLILLKDTQEAARLLDGDCSESEDQDSRQSALWVEWQQGWNRHCLCGYLSFWPAF